MELKKKLLHIVRDEKFIDWAWDTFEQNFPDQNEFIIIGKARKLRHISRAKVCFLSPLDIFRSETHQKIIAQDIVFIHWLGPLESILVNLINRRSNFCWIGWGGDYYDLIKNVYIDQLGPLTKKITPRFFSLHLIKKAIFAIMDWLGVGKRKAITYINNFAPVIYNDYNYLKLSSKSNFPNFQSWNYGDLSKMVDPSLKFIEGNSVLLGNSATPSNNHLEALSVVLGRASTTTQIILPLSYGDLRYRKKILNYIQINKIQGCQPLLSFMELSEYNQILLNCSSFVMNHVRQQGYGNIIFGLYHGAKVFMNSCSPLYQFLKDQGCICFRLEEYDEGLALSIEEKRINRKCMENLFSPEVSNERTKVLVNNCLLRD